MDWLGLGPFLDPVRWHADAPPPSPLGPAHPAPPPGGVASLPSRPLSSELEAGWLSFRPCDTRLRLPLCSRFAGNMERQQTDNLLKPHASGTYLIRERPAEAERFAISIKYVEPGGQADPCPGAVLNRGVHIPTRSWACWVWPWDVPPTLRTLGMKGFSPRPWAGIPLPRSCPLWVSCLLFKGQKPAGGWSPLAQDPPWTSVSGQ